MRHPLRIVLVALAILVPAVLGNSSCGGGDDDNKCDGTIINNCTACNCEAPKEATCTAYPKGDLKSDERCCECH